MAPDRHTFHRYVQSLPDDLLISVAEDYAWLASFFANHPQGIEFRCRRDFCEKECLHRGLPAKRSDTQYEHAF